MLVLGINTVGDVCQAALVRRGQAALVRGGEAIAELSEPMARGHDARLASLVEELMRKAGVAFADLDRIAVVAGPGSFTGVRVGVAFARGLALALERPAVGLSSLEAAAPDVTGRVLVALPAKRRPPEQSWWAQVVDGGHGLGEPVEADAESLRKLAAGCAGVWGAGLEVLGLEAAPHAALPSAIAAARLAARLPADALPPPRPIYAREPDAKPMSPRP